MPVFNQDPSINFPGYVWGIAVHLRKMGWVKRKASRVNRVTTSNSTNGTISPSCGAEMMNSQQERKELYALTHNTINGEALCAYTTMVTMEICIWNHPFTSASL